MLFRRSGECRFTLKLERDAKVREAGKPGIQVISRLFNNKDNILIVWQVNDVEK
jgi:hypothetical protein